METLRNAVVNVTLEVYDVFSVGDAAGERYKVEITPAVGHAKRQVYRVEWDFLCPRYPEEGEGWVVRGDNERSNWFPPWLNREMKGKIDRCVWDV